MSSFYLTLSSMKSLIPYFFKVSSTIAPSLASKWAQELFLRPRRIPLSQKETDIMNSAKIETLQSGRKVYFWGQNPQAPIIGLIHGWESRAVAFHKWIPLFIEQGFQVMGWDGPAHGQSPGVKTSAPEIAKALAADLNELQISPHALVGHSLGGVVLGLLNQHLTLPLPKKIVLVSSPSNIVGVFDRFYSTIGLGKNSQVHFLKTIETQTGVSLEMGSLKNMKLNHDTDLLVIHDTEDREVPFEDFSELQKSWTNAKFIATDGLGHRRILRDLSVGHEISQFLKGPVQA